MDAALKRVIHPAWTAKPDDWRWTRPGDLGTQGIGSNWRTDPGMFNLLWLSMDLGAPPAVYDIRENHLSVILITGAEQARLAGRPLLEVAALLPLAEFYQLLGPQASRNPAERAYPLLQLLAMRRLSHANS